PTPPEPSGAAGRSRSNGSHGAGARSSGPARPGASASRGTCQGAYDCRMPELSTTDRGSVRVLTLDRPQVKNALSVALRSELLAALAAARSDDGVRVIVITGAGDAFCAGLDLRELEETVTLSPAEHREDTTA